MQKIVDDSTVAPIIQALINGNTCITTLNFGDCVNITDTSGILTTT